ncbi:MAG: 2Fe-2S iron-sulfur cluster-binding protein [Myxococcota bacterium]
MSGKNPYLKAPEIAVPKRAYKVRLKNTGETFEAKDLPYDEPGLPGSVLATLLHHGVEIDHACGGVLACSTCHVYVKKGADTCNEPSDDEEDMLDSAPAIRPESRLACQCVPDGSEEVEVEIPAWNRNEVKEGH